ncbi:MAG TPA: hypothetical protein VF681_06265 [Abditibacteriaceae bacterium]|jgi:hypothetical protein
MAENSLLSTEPDGAQPHGEPVADSGVAHERVALIKSLTTNNRFYALVPADSAIQNADTVDDIPHDLLLGIAYPCLEDGLNDFAVIRTSYETLDMFRDDEETQRELHEIIADARCNLTRRLMELLERIIARRAYFLGTDLAQFKTSAVNLMRRGFPRRDLDSMMKVKVFSSVEAADKLQNGETAESAIYRYPFDNSESLARLEKLSPRDFLLSLFSDVLDSVLEESNYASKDTFDRHIFQQFIALMFVSYASTDPVFYGTHPDDYGVSRDRDMNDTPLYKAIKAELCRIAGKMPYAFEPCMASSIEPSAQHQQKFSEAEPSVKLPITLANEDALLGPIASIRALALQLQKHSHEDTGELSHLILNEASRLVQELKRLGIISPLAYNPGSSDIIHD